MKLLITLALLLGYGVGALFIILVMFSVGALIEHLRKTGDDGFRPIGDAESPPARRSPFRSPSSEDTGEHPAAH